jgi:hypothetical protein
MQLGTKGPYHKARLLPLLLEAGLTTTREEVLGAKDLLTLTPIIPSKGETV